MRRAHCVIPAPNGAGKTTAAPSLLRDLLGLTNFVNADVIAQGLSGSGPRPIAFQPIGGKMQIVDAAVWSEVVERYGDRSSEH